MSKSLSVQEEGGDEEPEINWDHVNRLISSSKNLADGKEPEEDDANLDYFDDPELLSNLQELEAENLEEENAKAKSNKKEEEELALLMGDSDIADSSQPSSHSKPPTEEKEVEELMAGDDDINIDNLEAEHLGLKEKEAKVNSEQLKELNDRLENYKLAAKEKAKLLLIQVRKIKEMLEEVQTGIPVNMQEAPPPLKASALKKALDGESALSKQIAKVTQNALLKRQKTIEKSLAVTTEGIRRESSGSIDQKSVIHHCRTATPTVVVTPSNEKFDGKAQLEYSHLIETFQKQSTSLSAEVRTCIATKMKNEGLFLMRLKKVAERDKSLLEQSLKQSWPLPSFHKEMRPSFRQIINSDIQDNKLQIIVYRALNLVMPSGYKTINPYVYFKFEYPDEKFQSGSTPPISDSVSPLFNLVFPVNIERTKSFARKLPRLKVHFEVYSKNKIYKDDFIGSCFVKLGDLVDHCEAKMSVDLKNERRVVGKLDLIFRMKLTGNGSPEIRKEKIEHLFIDEFHQPNTATPSTPDTPDTPDTSTTPYTTATPATHVEKVSQEAVTSKKIPKNVNVQIQEKLPQDIIEESADTEEKIDLSKIPPGVNKKDMLDPHRVDALFGNDVIEAEIKQIDLEIAHYNVKKQNPPENLLDRKNLLSIQLKVLEVQVQTGKLTLPEYLEQLQKKIAEDQLICVGLKKMGKLEDAKRVLSRVKIMKNEWSSAQ